MHMPDDKHTLKIAMTQKSNPTEVEYILQSAAAETKQLPL